MLKILSQATTDVLPDLPQFLVHVGNYYQHFRSYIYFFFFWGGVQRRLESPYQSFQLKLELYSRVLS